jgi:hypothetical protein
MVAILVIAVTSGQLVLALLAIGPAITLLTGATLSSIEQSDPAHRSGSTKPGGDKQA